MADNIVINSVVEVVNISDPTTSLPVSIIEDTISIGSGTDQINVTTNTDNVAIVTGSDSVNISDIVEVLAPVISDVQVQIVEDSSLPFSKRVDFIAGTDDLFKGEALVGSPETSPAWRIKKLLINTEGDVAEVWASGTANFDKIWANRAMYSYT